MIDWHSHILPGMDDGSRNLAESVSMLEMQKAQGIRTVIATPHFYANDESVAVFLERRAGAFEALKERLRADLPQVMLGAEVRYYQGISRMENLEALRLEKSKLLLLEMPMTGWTEYMVRELVELSGKSSIQIVLAHIERYLNLQKSSVWERLRENGILMQTNASFFTSFATKRKAIALLEEGYVQFVGSDCHNLTSRSPQIGKAYAVIRKKLGDEYLNQMNAYGYSWLIKQEMNYL